MSASELPWGTDLEQASARRRERICLVPRWHETLLRVTQAPGVILDAAAVTRALRGRHELDRVLCSMATRSLLRMLVAEAAAEVAQLRCADQAARRLMRRAEAAPHLLTRRRAVIFVIALELGCEDSLLPILLRQLARVRRGQRRACGVGEALQETQRIRGDPHLRGCALGALSGSPDGRLVFVAALRVAELRAAVWLRRANAAGVAASRSQLLSALRRGWPSAALGDRAERLFAAISHRPLFARRVAQRFRRRFHVAWRRLPARAAVPDAVAQQRALPLAKVKN